MELKKYEVKGNVYEFACETWETRNAWGHKVTLFKNGYDICEHKVRYYNRTWESYQYRTCMLGAVETRIAFTYDCALERFKEEHNIVRLTKARKEEFEKTLESNERYQELKELKSLL